MPSTRKTFAILVLCLGISVAAWGASRAPAAFPGQNGKIAFDSTRDGGAAEIYVMNADGSGPTRLTTDPAADTSPVWSADGAKLSFDSERSGAGDIYTMNADGSSQTRLTTSPFRDLDPTWSPDGTKIAFVSERDGASEIYAMNADGSGQTNLTKNPAFDLDPAWSPDGTKIAFTSEREVAPGEVKVDVFVMNADGSNQVSLTSGRDQFVEDTRPSWSSDGTKIAFAASDDAAPTVPPGITVMASDGSAKTSLTQTAQDRNPAWSPDGSKVSFESTRAGNPEIFAVNVDGSGVVNLTNNPANDRRPDWQPIPTAECPDVPVGFATAQGCFTETEPGSGIFETEEKAWVGGFEIQPRAGGKLILDTEAPAVSESGTGVDVIFAGFPVPLPAAGLPVGFQDGSLEINQAGSLDKILLDLPIKGQVAVAWENDGTEAKLGAELEIEKLASPIGSLVTTSSLTTIGQTGGKLEARLVNGQGFVLDKAEVAIDEISVIPSSLKIPRTLTLKNLLLRFEIRNDKPLWTGRAGIQLPLARGGLDVTGTVFIFDGSPAGGGLAVSSLNRPIGATPIFLQGASGELSFTPKLGYDLGVEGSLGPRVNGKQLLTLNGTMQGGDPAAADCPAGDDPAKLLLSSKLTPLEPLGAAGLAESQMSGRSCVYAGAGRAIELQAAVGIAFLNGALAYEASQTGLVSTNGANLEGAATVKLPAVPDLEGRAIISTKGTAACADFGFVEAGFGHEWRSSSPPSAFEGCDLGPFGVAVNPRPKRGAASGSIDVPAGLPHAALAVAGASGPPLVTVRGPGGVSVSSPADGSSLLAANAVIVPAASENTTYVLVRKPRAGAWRVESTEPANPLTSVRFAAGLDDPKVKGNVSPGRKRFRLRYSLREIPGQKVTLFETGEGILRKLGKARRAGGSIAFEPTLATDRKHTIEAEVTQDGLPRELITVARFKAPALPMLRRPELEAKRRRDSLALSWSRIRGASGYLVEVRAGSDVLFRVLSPKRKLRFDGTPATGRLAVTARALSVSQPPGPIARLKLKTPR